RAAIQPIAPVALRTAVGLGPICAVRQRPDLDSVTARALAQGRPPRPPTRRRAPPRTPPQTRLPTRRRTRTPLPTRRRTPAQTHPPTLRRRPTRRPQHPRTRESPRAARARRRLSAPPASASTAFAAIPPATRPSGDATCRDSAGRVRVCRLRRHSRRV